MDSLIQKIYWKLPYYLKNAAASLNAAKLDRQRHNEHFYEVIKQLEQQNNWSPERFKAYQEKQLREVIKIAAFNVPYYRQLFSSKCIEIDNIKDFEDIRKLPVLEKSVVREQPESLLDETLDRNKLMRCSTSGTTGTPLRLYRTGHLNAAAFAFIEARNHAIVKMQRRINRSVSIGGYLVAAPDRKRPPFWVYNKRWDQLYLSSYHLSPSYLGYYIDKLRSYNADYIEGYPSSVSAIAQYIVENGLTPIEFKACFTTAEVLTESQRELIRKGFCCKTYNQYGCTELAIFATECSEGNMHLSPEVSYVEVLDENDQPVPSGQTGQLVCTTLLNKVQPLIRYKIGDSGALDANNECKCGSFMPILKSIEGRSDHLLITKDGRKIGRLDPIFKGVEGVREAQVVQKDYDRFIIRIVPEKNYSQKNKLRLIENMAQRVGPADIQVLTVDNIERTASGKFRAVVCELSDRKNME